jgi:hypothetical protein
MIGFCLMQGLSDVILGGQPSLSVISNGAECILLDKQFYEQNAPEALLQRLRFYEVCHVHSVAVKF